MLPGTEMKKCFLMVFRNNEEMLFVIRSEHIGDVRRSVLAQSPIMRSTKGLGVERKRIYLLGVLHSNFLSGTLDFRSLWL